MGEGALHEVPEPGRTQAQEGTALPARPAPPRPAAAPTLGPRNSPLCSPVPAAPPTRSLGFSLPHQAELPAEPVGTHLPLAHRLQPAASTPPRTPSPSGVPTPTAPSPTYRT